MTTRDVPLPRALSIDEHEELRKQLCWITTAIDRIESELDSPAVRITFNDAPTDDLVAEITSAAARIVSVFEHLPEKILHETTTRPTCACATAYDDLVDRGDVRPMGEGLHNYGGVTARLFSALAATFRRTARSLGAEEAEDRAVMARFFAANRLAGVPGLLPAVTAGAGDLSAARGRLLST